MLLEIAWHGATEALLHTYQAIQQRGYAEPRTLISVPSFRMPRRPLTKIVRPSRRVLGPCWSSGSALVRYLLRCMVRCVVIVSL